METELEKKVINSLISINLNFDNMCVKMQTFEIELENRDILLEYEIFASEEFLENETLIYSSKDEAECNYIFKKLCKYVNEHKSNKIN